MRVWCVTVLACISLICVTRATTVTCARCLFDYQYQCLLGVAGQIERHTWAQNRSDTCNGFYQGLAKPWDICFNLRGTLTGQLSKGVQTYGKTSLCYQGPNSNSYPGFSQGIRITDKITVPTQATPTMTQWPTTTQSTSASVGQYGPNGFITLSGQGPEKGDSFKRVLPVQNLGSEGGAFTRLTGPNEVQDLLSDYFYPTRRFNAPPSGWKFSATATNFLSELGTGASQQIQQTNSNLPTPQWCSTGLEGDAVCQSDREDNFFERMHAWQADFSIENRFSPSDKGWATPNSVEDLVYRPMQYPSRQMPTICFNNMDCDHTGTSSTQGSCSPTGNTLRCDKDFGVPTVTGYCRCKDMDHLGPDCSRTLAGGGGSYPNPVTDNSPPDAHWAVCSGNGDVIFDAAAGVGWHCQCYAGWAGGNDPAGWVSPTGRRIRWTPAQQRLIYAIVLTCNGQDNFDPTTTLAYDPDYYLLHQCQIFVGDGRRSDDYTITGGTVPAPLTQSCANTRVGPACHKTVCKRPDNVASYFWDPTNQVYGCDCKPLYDRSTSCFFSIGPIGVNPDTGKRELCSGHGTVISGFNNCKEQNGGSDRNCLINDPTIFPNRFCACDEGWAGTGRVQDNQPICGIRICPSDKDGVVCGPNGRCQIDLSTMPSSGQCVCSAPSSLDPNTGLCAWTPCKSDDLGQECGISNSSTVDPCTHAPTNPVCVCHTLAPNASLPTMSDNLTLWRYRDANGLCTKTYLDACAAQPGDTVGCNGHGDCVPDGCKAGDKYSNCSVESDLEGAPKCMCDGLSKGNLCQESICGGFSFDKPCTKGDEGQMVTGHCNTQTQQCDCIVVEGLPYVGPTCAHQAQGCTSLTTAGVCSNHGTCTHNSSADNVTYHCVCDNNYIGEFCETLDTCSATCPIDKGRCVGLVCECFANFGGTDCATDFCTSTGGVQQTPDTCQCPPGSVQYPSARDTQPYDTFRGCRKLCNNTHQLGNRGCEECGSYDLQGQSRCSLPPVAANVAGEPVCSCADKGINTITRQTGVTMVDAEDGSGVCAPKCVHCLEDLTTGDCNTTACPQREGFDCQYQGPRCNLPLCGPHRHSIHNGTACECWPTWLYAGDPDCEQDVCTATGGTPPQDTTKDALACICPTGLTPDTDPSSATYRLCVVDCGDFGVYNHNTSQCECTSPVFGGTSCQDSLCAPGLLADGTRAFTPSVVIDPNTTRPVAATCGCAIFGYTGVFCNETSCGGGVPPPTDGPDNATCVCGTAWEGPLCNAPACVRGTPSDNSSTASCICDPGWTGQLCDENECGHHVPVAPEPCGGPNESSCVFASFDYNCDCGQLGMFVSSGHCEGDFDCGDKGHLHGGVNNSDPPSCVCDWPWVGPRCGSLPCNAPNTTFFFGSQHFAYTHHTEYTRGEPMLCDCIEPWSGNTTGCQDLDCDYFNQHEYVNPDQRVVARPSSRNTCECEDPSNYDLVDTHSGSSAFFKCVLRCSVHNSDPSLNNDTHCACLEGFVGRRCDQQVPPAVPILPINPGIDNITNDSRVPTRPLGPAHHPTGQKDPVIFPNSSTNSSEPGPSPLPSGTPDGSMAGVTVTKDSSLSDREKLVLEIVLPIGGLAVVLISVAASHFCAKAATKAAPVRGRYSLVPS